MIAIASDHAGFELKEQLINYFNKNNIAVKDLGTNSLDSVDYPEFGIKLGEEIATGNYEYGIAICGTGIGISIAANKVSGIRAALVYDTTTASLAKKHNNANIIAFGGRTTTLAEAISYINAYNNEVYEQRHQKRLNIIRKYEESKWAR